MESVYPWFLEMSGPDQSPLKVPLNSSEFAIGRGESCQLILGDTTVSRRHCLVFFDMGDPFVKDLGSSNGTYVNGVLVDTPVRLRDKDDIRIGSVNFVIKESPVSEEIVSDSGTIVKDGPLFEMDFAEKYQLSEREYEVLFLLIKDFSVKGIADKLFISPGTAKNHVLNIYKKTDCHSRIQLANKYREESV